MKSLHLNVSFVLAMFWVFMLTMSWVQNASAKKNVLLIIADDMRPQLNAYEGSDFPVPVSPTMQTPSLDALAAESMVFKRAYSQQAVCNPSRSSFLTSRRPDTTQVYNGETYWRTVGGNFTTLPQYFKNNGYVTLGMGKVYHQSPKSGINFDPPSWSEDYFVEPSTQYWRGKSGKNSWLSVDNDFIRDDSALPDDEIAGYAIQSLQRLAPEAKTGQKPFFMAVGFKRPHLPFIAPKKYFDMYGLENIDLPQNPYAPYNMPEYAQNIPQEILAYDDIDQLPFTGEVNTTMSDTYTKDLRRAYYACISYIDDLVGQVVGEVGRQGLEDNTVVVFMSDHGYHLGEHAHWTKNTNFELDTHVPLIIKVPGRTDGGKVTRQVVELVDLFPTLVDLAGFPKLSTCNPDTTSSTPLCTEGSSLSPLLSNPEVKGWKKVAYSQYLRSTTMGYSVRTDTHRYTEWVQYRRRTQQANFDVVLDAELYDHTKDPNENTNVADDPQYKAVRDELNSLLRSGWFANSPTVVDDENVFPGHENDVNNTSGSYVNTLLSLQISLLLTIVPVIYV